MKELCEKLGYTYPIYKDFYSTEFHFSKKGGQGVRLVFKGGGVRVSRDLFKEGVGFTIFSAAFSPDDIESVQNCIEKILKF